MTHNGKKCILCRYLRLARTYSPRSLEEVGPDLEAVLSMVVVFMGWSGGVHNPHLRALLASSLECLLPKDPPHPALAPNPLGTFYRQSLFINHPHASQV